MTQKTSLLDVAAHEHVAQPKYETLNTSAVMAVEALATQHGLRHPPPSPSWDGQAKDLEGGRLIH